MNVFAAAPGCVKPAAHPRSHSASGYYPREASAGVYRIAADYWANIGDTYSQDHHILWAGPAEYDSLAAARDAAEQMNRAAAERCEGAIS